MTTFQTIRGYIRTLVSDSDPQNYVYSDDTLNSQISFTILELNRTDIQQTGDPSDPDFATDLVGLDVVSMALRVTINLVAGQDNEFSYRTAVTSVRRSGAARALYNHLTEKLLQVEGGKFAFASDDEISAYVYEIQRIVDNINNSITNGIF